MGCLHLFMTTTVTVKLRNDDDYSGEKWDSCRLGGWRLGHKHLHLRKFTACVHLVNR